MMKTPLIFIHKSNIKDSQEYLYDTFRVAKKYNPDMDIYLLGDGNNKHYADKVGIKFEYYDDYSGGEESEKFEKVFQVIKGPHHGSEEWIKFVFKRWFYIYNFIKSKSFKRWDYKNPKYITEEPVKKPCVGDLISLINENLAGDQKTIYCMWTGINSKKTGKKQIAISLSKTEKYVYDSIKSATRILSNVVKRVNTNA